MLSRHFVFDFRFQEEWRRINQQKIRSKIQHQPQQQKPIRSMQAVKQNKKRTTFCAIAYFTRHSQTSVENKINVYVASKILCICMVVFCHIAFGRTKQTGCEVRGLNHLFYFFISTDSVAVLLLEVFALFEMRTKHNTTIAVAATDKWT